MSKTGVKSEWWFQATRWGLTQQCTWAHPNESWGKALGQDQNLIIDSTKLGFLGLLGMSWTHIISQSLLESQQGIRSIRNLATSTRWTQINSDQFKFPRGLRKVYSSLSNDLSCDQVARSFIRPTGSHKSPYCCCCCCFVGGLQLWIIFRGSTCQNWWQFQCFSPSKL